jgi:hypothetical protein
MALALLSGGGSHEEMSWIDSNSGCSEDCTGNPTLHISDFTYSQGGYGNSEDEL